jgi:hypothetical protein
LSGFGLIDGSNIQSALFAAILDLNIDFEGAPVHRKVQLVPCRIFRRSEMHIYEVAFCSHNQSILIRCLSKFSILYPWFNSWKLMDWTVELPKVKVAASLISDMKLPYCDLKRCIHLTPLPIIYNVFNTFIKMVFFDAEVKVIKVNEGVIVIGSKLLVAYLGIHRQGLHLFG